MSTPTASALIILLHGVGSNGRDLLPLANVLNQAVPGAISASPDAPEGSSFGSGHQWFSVAGISPANRADRIRHARVGFDETVGKIIRENGFEGRLDRVAFVGFSQGTIMALDAITSGRWPVAAVVGFSGRLASPPPQQPCLETAILLVHGAADAVIPAEETVKAASALEQYGMRVESMIIPALPHTISADGAARAGAFLDDIFKP